MNTKQIEQEKNEWLDILSAEKIVFGLLGKILFEFPEKEWINLLAKDGIFEEIPFAEEQPNVISGLKLFAGWNDRNKNGVSIEEFEKIKDDYTRLFIGPGEVQAPPWESLYFQKERIIFQEQTLKVREWYRRYGLESVKLYNEPDDHIGLELAFISHLAGLSISALEDNKNSTFKELIDAKKVFLSDHILKWANGWIELVTENSRSDFYQGTALVIKGALTELASKYSV
jgi:putative dimethyl sulfoxide reductase chaperone